MNMYDIDSNVIPFGDKVLVITVAAIETRRSILKTRRQYGMVFLIIHGGYLLFLTVNIIAGKGAVMPWKEFCK